MLANVVVSVTFECLTHRIRQQAGSYRNIRNHRNHGQTQQSPQQPKITVKRSNPRNKPKSRANAAIPSTTRNNTQTHQTVGAGLLANRGCQPPQMCLTHRIRQQPGIYSNLALRAIRLFG